VTVAVRLEDRDGVLVANLDDGKANALTPGVIGELRGAITTATDRSTPLVIVGRPGRFCAGFDLSIIRSDGAPALLDDGRLLFRDFLQAPIPIVVACTGHALAAGALLLLSADYRIGSTEPAKIGLNEVRIGLALPRFGIALARERLDQKLHTQAMMLGEVGDPVRAMELGYLDAVVEDPVTAAVSYAAELVAGGDAVMAAFATTKQRVREPLLAELEAIPAATATDL
jgi:enoyl-CoA hydratase